MCVYVKCTFTCRCTDKSVENITKINMHTVYLTEILIFFHTYEHGLFIRKCCILYRVTI